jgi:alpha/beta superfamily hydrolase
MQIPVTLKPAIWGAVAGAAAVAIVGFSWGGWVGPASAELLATQRASTAVANALAPICLENYRRAADAPAKLAELKKASSWEQASFVEKAGWAKMPGAAAIDPVMARACAALIIAEKS